MGSSSKLSATELAKKLDADIDNFIDDLIAKRKPKPNEPTKPFDFAEWSKEMDEHPMFLKNQLSDDPMSSHSDAIEALKSLKYDASEEPKEAAEFSRIEGNKHFKHKQYRSAVKCYTEGWNNKDEICDFTVLITKQVGIEM